MKQTLRAAPIKFWISLIAPRENAGTSDPVGATPGKPAREPPGRFAPPRGA
ncbi:hypothetical protein ACFOKI_06295 [Sphingomonas qilianensis]|uniref:Uncharacterized protein n=1 Tax=Sphingomonas qilianensis TaxID=1736690 RepID=A0ABU9XTE4_9SPHN